MSTNAFNRRDFLGHMTTGLGGALRLASLPAGRDPARRPRFLRTAPKVEHFASSSTSMNGSCQSVRCRCSRLHKPCAHRPPRPGHLILGARRAR